MCGHKLDKSLVAISSREMARGQVRVDPPPTHTHTLPSPTRTNQVVCPISRWLIEGVSWTPNSIPADLLVEPPPLTEFKVGTGTDSILTRCVFVCACA